MQGAAVPQQGFAVGGAVSPYTNPYDDAPAAAYLLEKERARIIAEQRAVEASPRGPIHHPATDDAYIPSLDTGAYDDELPGIFGAGTHVPPVPAGPPGPTAQDLINARVAKTEEELALAAKNLQCPHASLLRLPPQGMS
jgi:hypothetical protein